MEYDRTRTQKDYHPSRWVTPWAKLSRRTAPEGDKIGMVGTSSHTEKLFLALDCRLVPDRQKLSAYTLSVQDQAARPYPGQRKGQRYVTITLILKNDCYDGTSVYGEYALQCNYQGLRRLEPRFDQVHHCGPRELMDAQSILLNAGPSFVTRSGNIIKVRVYERGSSVPVYLSNAPDSAADYFAEWKDLDDVLAPWNPPGIEAEFPDYPMVPTDYRAIEERILAHTHITNCRCVIDPPTQPTEGNEDMTTRTKQNAVVRSGTGYAMCTSPGSSKQYTYFCADQSVQEGDFVVVSTPHNSGELYHSKDADGYLKVVKVVSRTPTAAQKTRATHHVVSRVALGDYSAIVDQAERTEELNGAIRDAAARAKERAELNALAAHSPELRNLLAERDSLTQATQPETGNVTTRFPTVNTLGMGGSTFG